MTRDRPPLGAGGGPRCVRSGDVDLVTVGSGGGVAGPVLRALALRRVGGGRGVRLDLGLGLGRRGRSGRGDVRGRVGAAGGGTEDDGGDGGGGGGAGRVSAAPAGGGRVHGWFLRGISAVWAVLGHGGGLRLAETDPRRGLRIQPGGAEISLAERYVAVSPWNCHVGGKPDV